MHHKYAIPYIDQNHCDGCGTCARICPCAAIVVEQQRARLRFPARCTFCGCCEMQCHRQAINRLFSIVFADDQRHTDRGSDSKEGTKV